MTTKHPCPKCNNNELSVPCEFCIGKGLLTVREIINIYERREQDICTNFQYLSGAYERFNRRIKDLK
jgi:hypothetical protein